MENEVNENAKSKDVLLIYGFSLIASCMAFAFVFMGVISLVAASYVGISNEVVMASEDPEVCTAEISGKEILIRTSRIGTVSKKVIENPVIYVTLSDGTQASIDVTHEVYESLSIGDTIEVNTWIGHKGKSLIELH